MAKPQILLWLKGAGGPGSGRARGRNRWGGAERVPTGALAPARYSVGCAALKLSAECSRGSTAKVGSGEVRMTLAPLDANVEEPILRCESDGIRVLLDCPVAPALVMAVSAMQLMPPLDKTPVLAEGIADGGRTAPSRLVGFGAANNKPTQVLASGLA